MRRPWRDLLGVRWVALHLAVVGLTIAMIFLGRWQLHVSEHKGFSLQNFFYAFQWWTFCGFLLYFWFKVVRDHLKPPPPTEATGELVVAQRGDAAPGPGPTLMVAEPTHADAAPTLYRGYVMPQLSQQPDRTGDRTLRDPYNDHLWQLALADAAKGEGPAPRASRPLVDAPTLAARARAAEERRLAGGQRPALPETGRPDPDRSEDDRPEVDRTGVDRTG